MSKEIYSSFVEIDYNKIKENAEKIKIFANGKLIAVVKADAYGHKSEFVAHTLGGIADMFAVATVKEGIELRSAGVTTDILVLFSSILDQIPLILKYKLTPTVNDWKFADQLNKLTSEKIKIHINVNTGLNRSGIHWKESLYFLDKIKSLRNIEIEGIFTHFATADEKNKAYVHKQIKRFKSIISNISESNILIHAANSAAILAVPESHFDAVRPGLSLYGVYPANEKPIELTPALAWKTRIGWTEILNKNEGISYGLTFKTKENTRVAMIHIGYGDGYPRSLSNIGEVLVKGNRRRIIGCVCMDTTVIKLEPDDDVSIGDEVVLIGKQGEEEITCTELANLAVTIPYEILAQIGNRVPRVLI